MNKIDFRKHPEIVVDEEYEGLLSSYIEPDAHTKISPSDDYPDRISKIALPPVPQLNSDRLDRFKIKCM
jgi:hypothetical protein